MTAVQFAQYRNRRGGRWNGRRCAGTTGAGLLRVEHARFAERFEAKYAAAVKQVAKRCRRTGCRRRSAGRRRRKNFRVTGGAHYMDLVAGRGVRTRWAYHGAYCVEALGQRPEVPAVSTDVVVIPPTRNSSSTSATDCRTRASAVAHSGGAHVARRQTLPTLRCILAIRAATTRACRWRLAGATSPSMRRRASRVFISGTCRSPKFAQRLSRHAQARPTAQPRGVYRPAQHLQHPVALAIDYVETSRSAFEQWPPESHKRIFHERKEPRENLRAKCWRGLCCALAGR